MTAEDTEMVTIEIPASDAKKITNLDPKAHGGPSGIYETMKACKAALAARKSPYDRWKETLFLPWERVPGNSATVTDLRFNVRPGIHSASSHSDEMDQLTGAAPELLEALVAMFRLARDMSIFDGNDSPGRMALAALRAAVPTDVADYLLNKGTE